MSEDDGHASRRAARSDGERHIAAAQASANYRRITQDIEIAVAPSFLDSQSFPELEHFVWAYRVEIRNNRPDAVRLRWRYWRITDSFGRVEEVEGEGVVGEQPLIEPGGSYSYTSGAPLKTASGMMGGRYEMESASGERFFVEIPTFSLDSPHEARTLN